MRNTKEGTALVAAMVTLLISAGMIGGLYAMARAANRVATGVERTRSLEEIADGMMAACPRIIYFVANDQNPATVFTALPGMNLAFDPYAGAVLPVTGMGGELQSAFDPLNPGPLGYIWYSDRGVVNGQAVVYPDMVLQTREHFIFVDVDLLYRQETKGGTATEFGAGAEESAQTQKQPMVFRCTTEVWQRCNNDTAQSPNNFCPHATATGFIRVEREISPQFIRLWGAR